MALLQISNDIGVRNVGSIFEKGMEEPMKKSLRKKRFVSCFMPWEKDLIACWDAF